MPEDKVPGKVVLQRVVTREQNQDLDIQEKIGFEGGQMPLQRRVPKFGFKNINRIEYKPINLDLIQNLIDKKSVTVITPEVLKENGLVGNNELVKILGRGELKGKVEITAHKFSASAKTSIEAQGGKCSEI